MAELCDVEIRAPYSKYADRAQEIHIKVIHSLIDCIEKHDHIVLTDTGELLEFCDPRIQNIKATIEEIFDIEIQHHSLYFYGVKRKKS